MPFYKSINCLYLLIIPIYFVSCDYSTKKIDSQQNNRKSRTHNLTFESENSSEDNYTEGFDDGTYPATVDYYNPHTGYSETYYLDVEVQDNEVTTIYFSNGGYLDDDHIYPEELDDQGFVSIEGEEGKTYDIQIDY
jgi:hypothetical protein